MKAPVVKDLLESTIENCFEARKETSNLTDIAELSQFDVIKRMSFRLRLLVVWFVKCVYCIINEWYLRYLMSLLFDSKKLNTMLMY